MNFMVRGMNEKFVAQKQHESELSCVPSLASSKSELRTLLISTPPWAVL